MRVSTAQVSARLFSYRGRAYLNLKVSSLADSRPSATEQAVTQVVFTHCLLLFGRLGVELTKVETGGKKKKAGRAQGT